MQRTTNRQHKPPSIPSARTDAERTISSKGPTIVATDIIDSFNSLTGVETKYPSVNPVEKTTPEETAFSTRPSCSFFPSTSFKHASANQITCFIQLTWFFADSTGQRSQAQADGNGSEIKFNLIFVRKKNFPGNQRQKNFTICLVCSTRFLALFFY